MVDSHRAPAGLSCAERAELGGGSIRWDMEVKTRSLTSEREEVTNGTVLVCKVESHMWETD